MPIRVVIGDRNRLVRDLIARACRRRGVEVVANAADLDAILALADTHKPDIVIMSDPLAGSPVGLVVGDLVGRGIQVVVVGDDRSAEGTFSVLEQGASSYVMYDTGPDALADAVVCVAGGGVALHDKVAELVLEQWRQLRADRRFQVNLTTREREVLVAMADGLPTKAIARRLGVALKTVESHKIRLFDKLGARTQAHAVSIAMANGLLPAQSETPTAS